MNLPYQRYLLWLYLDGKTKEEVKAQFDDFSLVLPPDEVLADIERQASELPLPPPTRRRLGRFAHDERDEAVMKRLGFLEIYLQKVKPNNNGPWKEVYAILKNAVARVALDSALICKHTIPEISVLFPSIMKEPVSEEALQLYCLYFFDHYKMGKRDWRQFLKICDQNPYVYLRYHTALTKPADEVMYLVGMPSKPQYVEFLKNVLATADFKFRYYSKHQSKISDGQARTWAKVGIEAGEKFEKFSSGDVADFSKTVQTEFDYVTDEIPNLPPTMLTQIKPPSDLVGAEAATKTKVPLLAPIQIETEV